MAQFNFTVHVVSGETQSVPPAYVAPTDFTVADAQTGGTLTVNIINVKADPNTANIRIEYDLDSSGSWVDCGRLTPGTFQITGLTDGVSKDVRLRSVNSVGNGDASNTASATPTTSSHSATITVLRRSVNQVAPEGFLFEVTLNGFDSVAPTGGAIRDDRFHEVYYSWDFDDSYTFAAPTNLPSEKLDSQYAYGPMVSHTYRAAGAYTVSCTIEEPSSGKSFVATLDVTVADNSSLFSGTNTIFVDPDSNWTNAPSGALQRTSISSALSTALGQQSTPKRIMLNRGKAYTFGGTSLGRGSGTALPDLILITAGPGAGAKPEVTCTGTVFDWHDSVTTGNGEDKDFVVQDINWTGGWNPVTESGSKPNFFNVYGNSPNMLLIDGCTTTNFEIHYYITNSALPIDHRVTVLNDATIHGWRDYGIQSADSVAFVTTGSSVRQNINALCGGPKDGTHNDHNPFRQGIGARIIMLSSEYFSRNGWFDVSGYQSVQPCLRLHQSSDEGSKYVITNNYFEGGISCVAFSSQGGHSGDAINALLEKNIFMGTMQTSKCVATNCGGVTIRNNIGVLPDITYVSQSNPSTFVSLDSNSTAAAKAAAIEIYSNTWVSWMSDANYRGGNVAVVSSSSNGGSFATVVDQNNINYQPNVTGGSTSDGPLEVATNQWTPYGLKGYIDDVPNVLPEEATPVSKIPTSSAGNFTPGSTLTASGGATAVVCQTFPTFVYVNSLSGPIASGETLTESPGSGAATANGAAVDTGFTATYVPQAGAGALDPGLTGAIAFDDYYGTERTSGNEDRGAIQVTA